MRASQAVFSALLAACPREMRDEYGAAMRDDFAASVRARGFFAAVRACADVLEIGIMERFGVLSRDLAFALRSMRRTPLFALVVIATMAIAIGANGAVYGLIANLVFRPLPFSNSVTLDAIWEVDPVHGTTTEAFTYEDFAALRRSATTLTSVTALTPGSGTLIAPGGPAQSLRGADVSGDFFQLYSARPVLGRLLDTADEREGASPVVISEGLWRSRFAARRSVIGSSVELADVRRTIVGVVPASFAFLDLWRRQIDRADYFVPVRASAYRGTGHQLLVVARATASPGAVDADLRRVFASLAAAHPDTDANLSARAISAHEALFGPSRPALVAVALAALAVLGIACANVANLFVSRSSVRAGEIATRFALGAGRRRLIAQLLTETSCYVVLGGLFGAGCAAIGVALLASTIDALLPPPLFAHLGVDWKTFAVTGAAIVLAAVLAGALPAIALSRPDLASAMKRSDRTGTGGGALVRAVLVTLEVALAVAIVSTAAIATRSFAQLAAQPMGFDANGVAVAFVGSPSAQRYGTAAQANAFLEAIRSRVAASPGVVAAGWAQTLPFFGESQVGFAIERTHYSRGSRPLADLERVSIGYTAALRIPLITGRDLAASDAPHSAPVAVVSRSFADRYLGGPGHAVGKRITLALSSMDVAPAPRTVIGVVGDVRDHVTTPAEPTIYAPLAQIPNLQYLKLVVRSSLSTAQVAAVVNAATEDVDATVPTATAASLEREQATDAADRQMLDQILMVLAGIALILAIAGIYAVVSYGVAQRTRELGVRIAFGATPRTIVMRIVGDSLRLAAAGIAFGLVLAGIAAWLLNTFLDVAAPIDPITVTTVLAIIAGAIGIAAFVPARRAGRIDPVAALRFE